MNTKLIHIFKWLLGVFLLAGCSGKHITVVNPDININQYHQAFIVDNTNSKARGVNIIPMPGFVISTPSKVEEVKGKGNIAEIIYTELQKYGFESTIGAEGIEIPNNIDFVVRYDDLWQWDVKYYLHTLKLKFIGRNDGVVIAEGTYNSSIVHNYPNPKEVIPIIISDIINSPQKRNKENFLLQGPNQPLEPSR